MSLVGFKAQNHNQQVGKRGALDKVDDRRTPRSLFDPLNEHHRFTLDTAASRENALCEKFWTPHEDGLIQPWLGRVWCNPPYSDCRAWVEKAWVESRVAKVIVMLLPANRTEQGWWQDFVEPYRDNGGILTVQFLRGRLRFDTPGQPYDDPRGNRPPFGCALLTWRGTTGAAEPPPPDPASLDAALAGGTPPDTSQTGAGDGASAVVAEDSGLSGGSE